MDERYLPPSQFLQAAMKDGLSFGNDEVGSENLARLISMTSDPAVANRDWAVLLLSQLQSDRAEVKEALFRAASDENPFVRAEAIVGLAHIDRSIASPLVLRELKGNMVSVPLLEAAILVADESLVEDLEAFAAPSDNDMLDRLVAKALTACRSPN